jgi:glutamine amidotransferase
MEIAIIDYGAGNIKSLQFALQRLGFESVVTHDAEIIKKADKVIFPGVGEASSAMAKLRDSGLDQLIPTLRQPVLGICLGMQLLCNASEEGNTVGLGIFNVEVTRFRSNVKVPHMGWNTIANLKTELFNGISEGAYMYLVHSYFAPICEDTIAVTEYGIPYSTALQKNNFYGVQFHPEKSSKEGQRILKNFLEI